jgi:hypothetical protein
MHRSTLGVVVVDIDEPDHDKGLAFWAEALGATATRVKEYPEYHSVRGPAVPTGFLVQRIGGPSRVHLDIYADNVEAEVARLEAAGAERVEFIDKWQVMRDPAGMLFCVVPAPAGKLDDTNSIAWP